MKNLEKEIEKKTRELNRYKTKLIILDYISNSRYSIEQECKEFGISKEPITIVR